MDPTPSAARDTVHVALIGDVVGSRQLEDRAGVQRELRMHLSRLSEELADRGLEAPLEVVSGDEVQGLWARPGSVVDAVVGLAEALHPVRLVWGLGAGAVDTDLSGRVSAMDGPCFHRAREALEDAAREGVWLRTGGWPAGDAGPLEALFRLMGAIRAGWTETQARYARAVRGRLQKEVAEEFGVSPSVVSESLKAARFRDLAEGEAAARALLDRFASEGESSPGSASKGNSRPAAGEAGDPP